MILLDRPLWEPQLLVEPVQALVQVAMERRWNRQPFLLFLSHLFQ
jgi:hypothetical protein